MVRRYYDLPSLKALATFEASARHLSFKLAASELNVTPSAVSRQITALEKEIGDRLFVRFAAGVGLTSAGQELYAALARGFSTASEVVRTIRGGTRAKNVIIGCGDTMTSVWLIPLLPKLWARHGDDIIVDHVMPDQNYDYRNAEIDLRIRYSFGAWPDERSEFLFDERIYPVCGPEFASKYSGLTAELLPTVPLLHEDWVGPEWLTWSGFLRTAGISHSGVISGRRFNRHFMTVQAAQANQGVALGWHRLAHPLITEGKLCRITDVELPAPGGYYLSWAENRVLSSTAELVRDWLLEMAAEERNKDSNSSTIIR
ncbi:LysR family transcriptional regulator [Mesorhizobium waimense]|uniref:LysR family transcriptional regulator n=1 Tax=Mesorhizobium waimense TaxID=1300307 RepID=A0A3A5K778_9HYPH|nr:LysR family transcriptional regulator [Mesorhizobium waimense]RJT26720.1 LysR family transcriptional regulator [Mesorhizobium waimense]